jgi:hypothetical protein
VEYTVIFEVNQNGYLYWGFFALGLIFIVIGSGLFLFRRKLPSTTPKFVPYAFLGFSLFLTMFAFAGAVGGSASAYALREGNCGVVTGEVTQFHPMPETGHDKESFVVDGRRFEYSDFIVSPGFNNTSSHGGPIREGLKVRIHHSGNDILRLEIAK